MLYGYVTVYLVMDKPQLDDDPHNDGQLNVSHCLSRLLNNATGQCPVVCPSHVDNDGTVARGVSTSRCPIVCPVVPSCRRFLDQTQSNNDETIKLAFSRISPQHVRNTVYIPTYNTGHQAVLAITDFPTCSIILNARQVSDMQ